MKTIDTFADLSGKHVLLRTDFDVPVAADGRITETFRILRQRPMIQQILARGARVLLVAHSKDAPSFALLIDQLSELVGAPIVFCKDFDAAQSFWNSGAPLGLFENMRAFPEEETNDMAFAQKLVAGCDLYVNNGFAECHRPYASVVAVATLVPAYAGAVVVEETTRLTEVLRAPSEGKIIFMGGAKASTKVPVIRALIDTAQSIGVGGVIANDILKVRGVDVGSSRVDDDAAQMLAGLDVFDSRLVVPTDFVEEAGSYMDIGTASAQAFADLTVGATLIVWNGPFGKFEDPRFLRGTEVLARAIASSGAQTIIGGGDTVAAINQLGLADAYSFVSTGGGAMLAFLSGEKLPALEVLGYYQN